MQDGGVGLAPGPSASVVPPAPRRGRRMALVAAIAVAVFLAGGVGLWRTVRPTPSPNVTTPDRQSTALAGNPVIPSGSLAQEIASLQTQLRSSPGDWRSFANLGLAYVAQARITADPSYYPKAQGVLERSLKLDTAQNDVGLTGMGALSLARHQFAQALAWGERARRINPYGDYVYGVIGDAQVELGRYPQAFATFQHMVNLKPNLSSYARVSYARELRGNVSGALGAMRLAYQAAGNAPDASWASFQLGELYWNGGRPVLAERMYRRAVELDPKYVPPYAGLAKIAWAEGHDAQATRRYRSVVARYPLPEYVIALGDLYATTGHHALAEREYALVRTEEKLFQANGVNVDLELALFDADHGNVRAGLTAAHQEWGRRHSILVADGLAWALYHSGRAREALPYVHHALSRGMRNALLYFHAGMIEKAIGDTTAARRDLRTALAINPHFSILYATTAARTLRALGGGA